MVKWYKKNATVVKATAALALIVSYTAFVRGIQQDLDEVRYSREINKIDKEYSKEIDGYKLKIDQLREENMKLRQTQLELMEDYFNKNNKHLTETEVSNENK